MAAWVLAEQGTSHAAVCDPTHQTRRGDDGGGGGAGERMGRRRRWGRAGGRNWRSRRCQNGGGAFDRTGSRPKARHRRRAQHSESKPVFLLAPNVWAKQAGIDPFNHIFGARRLMHELIRLGRTHLICILRFYSKASASDGRASATGRADWRTTPTPSITPSATPPALSPPFPRHRRSYGDVRLSSPSSCRRWGAHRPRREAGGIGWRLRPASLLRAAESFRPPMSSPPQRRAAGGFERLPGSRRRPWRRQC